MKYKRQIKRPPSGGTEGGEGENMRASDIFYPKYNINPAYCKIDYSRISDIYRLKSDYWNALSEATSILAILQESEANHDN